MQLFTLRSARLPPLIIVSPYALFISLLLIQSIQRNVFYANKLNPTHWQDVFNVEQFNFHHAQVIPFTFHPEYDTTFTLHAWHFLPLPVYLAHESELQAYHNISTYPLSPRDLIYDSPLQFLTSNSPPPAPNPT
jgi:hypothetical protein